MSVPMFVDTEPGMGIWTRHTTEDGRVFYYNMKRDKSKWESDFQNEMHTVQVDAHITENAVESRLRDNDVEWRKGHKFKYSRYK